jgi:prepilin peptidase CpaA
VHLAEIVLSVLFPALLIVAAVSDLLTMTISNRLCAAMAAAFVPVAAVAGLGVTDIAVHVLAGAIMLAVGFALFIPGWIGGGDAKLAAVVVLWLGPMNGLAWALLSSVFGGTLTMALLSVRMMPLPAMLAAQPWIARLHDRKGGIPYGIALAAAGLLVYPQSALYLHLLG